MSQAQLDGGMVTPQEGGSEAGDQLDIQQYLDMYQAENNSVDMYSTQVDGDPGDGELEEPGTAAQPSMPSMTGEGDDVPAVSVAGPGPVSDHLSLASNQPGPDHHRPLTLHPSNSTAAPSQAGAATSSPPSHISCGCSEPGQC